ncbi:MAG: hypothetical protein AAGK00_07000 [Pseudomonadota bacterium]
MVEPNTRVPEQGVHWLMLGGNFTMPPKEHPSYTLAVGWLQDLYTTVRTWNIGFLRFLKTYPGFVNSTDPGAYKAFLIELGSYQAALDERTDIVKRDLCHKLHRLYDRFEHDFAYLKQSDPAEFDRLQDVMGQTYDGEDGIIRLAREITHGVMAADAISTSLSFEEAMLSPDLHAWHVANHDVIAAGILSYERGSAVLVGDLARAVDDADLNVTALETLAARNAPMPSVTINNTVNNTTNTTTNVDGPMINSGGGAVTYNAGDGVMVTGGNVGDITLNRQTNPDIAQAIAAITAYLQETGNEAAKTLGDALAEEAEAEEPEPSKIRQLWDTIVTLAPGVKAVTGAVAAVTALMA